MVDRTPPLSLRVVLLAQQHPTADRDRLLERVHHHRVRPVHEPGLTGRVELHAPAARCRQAALADADPPLTEAWPGAPLPPASLLCRSTHHSALPLRSVLITPALTPPPIRNQVHGHQERKAHS